MADEKKEEPKSSKLNFWDSGIGLLLLVSVILLARAYILEPYKIPSGSMEPTLVGHEDFGDRIVTNKLAFAPHNQVYGVAGAALMMIVLCFGLSKAWKRKKAIAFWVLATLAVPCGLLFAKTQDVVGRDPRRFDVTVFNYDTAWLNVEGKSQKINYIKRLWGLPNEELRISGGDVFLRKKGDYEIITKPAELQESAWFTVSEAWSKQSAQLSEEDSLKLAFPWLGAQAGTPGTKLEKNHLAIDGSAPVVLTYAHPVSNIYIKQGRWPFRHVGCPAVKNQPEMRDQNGIVWRNADAKTEDITAYVGHASHGVTCPSCNQLLFPLSIPTASHTPSPQIVDRTMGTNFLYGGEKIVGDLRLEMTLDVAQGGSVALEVGSNINRAGWTLGGAAPQGEGVHAVKATTPSLSPGEHKLSLAYYDGVVVATLDGVKIEEQKIDAKPIGAKQRRLESLVKLTFTGFKGSVTALKLSRDLFYTSPAASQISRHSPNRGLETSDGSYDYIVKIGPDEFLMMGDNSPGSSDGRMWGSVPRSELMGRAGVVWWPPSRWGVIK